ncbi:Uncharacterised protein [Mycobacterium tuberculosis]|uniref:Uncharacterized protein n=1 Tax=Mycobacterium tuberculosis TaxID=1773 RepID=A0A0T9EK70_MYCTX|nr:Uncharacterised protein [Mycobacterium tuberculosis]CFE78066.1 Uncharacterised protein [Mycobacterium tuberculosis]CFR86283.1 Uncharacterised protein [Mycobacterium tuberculosis]CKP78656.1 Uncharacterised protein [Mycobacterium tuberculosis]CKR87961.1 Uncharacterised protein [Mycobacterium tuberculosis]
MQAHHRDRADSVRMGLPHLLAQCLQVGCPQHPAVGCDPFIDLDDPLIKHLGQHDPPVEDARTILVGDAQGVAETAGDHQQCALTRALEQRIGRHRGAHPHRVDARARLAVR